MLDSIINFIADWIRTPSVPLDDYEVSGSVDKQIYDSLQALGWTDCIDTGASITFDPVYHGSWVDSGEYVSGHKVYKSDGSYHTANAWDAAKITFTGYTEFNIQIRSYAEGNYDYVLVSQLNDDYLASRTSANDMRTVYSNTTYTKAYTRGKQSATDYEAVTFTGLNASDTYYFYVIYQKDGSSDSNDDRGYFYIES